jgi:hypothetical protein
MQYKEFTESHSKDLIEQISSIIETHMIGKTVIVKGKKGTVLKQVGSDGNTESDEIYQVKFEDGTVADIPARDMEMQGDDNKKIGENEAEELVKEAKLGKQHGIKSDPAYKKAKTKKQIKQARDQWNLKNPNDLWVGESVMKEAKKVRVKTQSGTTERVSPDDLKAAGGVFDRIRRLKLAIADKQHAAHQKKVDKSRIRQSLQDKDNK